MGTEDVHVSSSKDQVLVRVPGYQSFRIKADSREDNSGSFFCFPYIQSTLHRLSLTYILRISFRPPQPSNCKPEGRYNANKFGRYDKVDTGARLGVLHLRLNGGSWKCVFSDELYYIVLYRL